MSEVLVGAAEGTGEALGMSATFIGIVFLAVDWWCCRKFISNNSGK